MEFLSPLSPVFVAADLDIGALIWVDPANPAAEGCCLAAVAAATGLPLTTVEGLVYISSVGTELNCLIYIRGKKESKPHSVV
jgi:hypothetical protein